MLSGLLAEPTIEAERTDALLEQLAQQLAAVPTKPLDEYLRGLDHHLTGAILRARFPELVHRRTRFEDHDEHLILDLFTGDGARADLYWDQDVNAVRTHVAEIGSGQLFVRIRDHVRNWALYDRTVPIEHDGQQIEVGQS